MRKWISFTLAAVLSFSMSLNYGVIGAVSVPAPVRTASTASASAAPIAAGAPAMADPAPATPQYAKTSVIVNLKSVPTAAEKRAFASAHGVSVKNVTQGVNKKQLSVAVPAGSTADALIAELAADPAVATADRNYIRHVTAYTATPNDPDFASGQTWTSGGVSYVYGKSWWLRNTGVSAFWTNYDNAPAAFPVRAAADAFKVGVIDTGFYLNHPDRGANIVAGKDECQTYSYGRLTKDTDVTPASETAPGNDRTTAAHGTCVAGEIAAATNNGVGVAGAGFDNQVRVYKVAGVWTEGDALNGYPAGSVVIFDQAIIDGIYSATNDGCKVINMSLGGPGLSSAMQTAINYANSKGVVVIAATGNNGVATNFYPAAANGVIGVGSYELNAAGSRIRSSFTNYGSQLDVLAPGKLVWGLTNPAYSTGYEWWQGTSMASPAFAGMLAMVWRFAPALTNTEITNVMLSSATAAGTGQPNTDYGYGFVNVAGAYAKLKADFPYLTAPAVATTKTAYAAEPVSLAWAPVAGRNVRYQLVRDGAVPTTQTAAATTLAGMAEGTHTVAVTAQSDYNWTASSTATYTFTVDRTAPVVSAVSFSANRFSWTDSEAGREHLTAIRIDIAATQTVTGDSYDVAEGSLVAGTHTIRIAEIDAVGNAGPAFVYTFDFGTIPVPTESPAVSADESVAGANVALTWEPVAGAASYEWQLNGVIDATPVTDLTVVVTGLVDGENTLRVRALNSRGEAGPWSDALTVQRLITYTVESSSTAAITYGGIGAALGFSVRDVDGEGIADHTVVLQYSYDNITWANLTTVTTDASGTAGYDFNAMRNAWVRPIVEGDAEYGSTTGDSVRVLVYPGLAKPYAPTTVTHKRSFTISGYLTPKHATGAHDVKIKLYRQKKAGAAFTYYKTVTATNSYYSSTKTRYSVKTSVSYTGSYRAYAYYVGTASFASMTSAYRQFRAK